MTIRYDKSVNRVLASNEEFVLIEGRLVKDFKFRFQNEAGESRAVFFHDIDDSVVFLDEDDNTISYMPSSGYMHVPGTVYTKTLVAQKFWYLSQSSSGLEPKNYCKYRIKPGESFYIGKDDNVAVVRGQLNEYGAGKVIRKKSGGALQLIASKPTDYIKFKMG